MKEIKSKTSSAKKTLVPWFETMGKQVGLSQETISAVLKEQRLRIRKLNYASAYTVSNILIQDCGGADDMWSNYAKLALILERCNTFAGAGPVHIVLPLSNYIIRGWM